MFRAAGDVRFHALRMQRIAQVAFDLFDVAFAIAALLVQPSRDLLVGVWLKMPERQILKLPLQLPDAQAVRQRGVNVAGELRQGSALGHRPLAGATHLRQLPRQQDRHHPQIPHHHQQQTAQTLGVAPAGIGRMQRPHLGCGALAFQQGRDRRPLLRQPGLDPRAPCRQAVQDRRQHHIAIGIQAREGGQGAPQFEQHPFGHRLGARCLLQSLPPWHAQRRHRRQRQQRIERSGGSGGHAVET